jgi:hypothetical protein
VETMISASSGIAPASGALGAHDAPEWCSRCAGITAHDAPEYALSRSDLNVSMVGLENQMVKRIDE